jgi:hypothetical protein
MKMSDEQVACLFCQVKNDNKLTHCGHCGMALAKQHPEGKARRSFFVKAFWGIVIFCLVMMYYLPR